ncbi:MAG: hypothetical protein LBD04_03995 [Synergistaceae bacterium]|jgi:uncharacterized membrane protein YkvI|nr:hypothetical protein [Synergistaceae bacterium]
MEKHSKFQRYFLPGFIFQSVVIAGGYGTGAELAEFFFPYGSLGGLLAMSVVTFLFWAVVCAVSFEFARVFKAYEYKSFFQALLGPGWVLYEICYIVLLLIVLAVVAAAAGANTEAVLRVNKWYGIAFMTVCVAGLVLKGTTAIENFLSFWSYVLYAVYVLFLIICFTRFGESIVNQLAVVKEIKEGWPMGGARYAFYNLGIIPAVLFSTRDAENRKEAIGSGLLAGAIGIVPAILLFVAMSAFYPEIASASVPVNYLFEKLNMPWLLYTFQIVLFGTLIETGAGFIKAVTDRLEIKYAKEGKHPPVALRPVVTLGCVLLGVAISTFGLTGLIAQGYGTITWGFFILYVAPVLTWGVYKIATAR